MANTERLIIIDGTVEASLAGAADQSAHSMHHARSSTLSSWLIDLALLAICSLPLLFIGLGDLPIVLWDESRLANNAIEMMVNGLGFVTTYLGHPDLWNTKPPLMIWLIAISFDLFGPSEWSLRLPSAVAALATTGIVYWLCRGVTASRVTGHAGALVLLTTYGFVAPHVARTGDYDALLIFFITALIACCYRILEDIRIDARPSSGLLVCTGLALLGAIMTKGSAGLLILPGIALASLAGGAILKALVDWRVWLAVCLPLVIVGSYYLAHETATAGYLEAVWQNELGGRLMSSIEGHRRLALFYVFELLWPWNIGLTGPYVASAFPWSWLALVLLPFAAREKRFQPVLAYLAIVLAMFLVVISAAQTKISWYVAPAYPLIACVLVISAFAVLQSAYASGRCRPTLLLLALFGLIAAIVGSEIVQRNRQEGIRALTDPKLQFAAFLRDVPRVLRPGDTLRILREAGAPSRVSPALTEYSPQESFYAALMRVHGIDARVVTPDYRVRPGDMLAWCRRAAPDMHEIASDQLISRGPCHLAGASGAGLPQPK